jgi:hypothetical protein
MQQQQHSAHDDQFPALCIIAQGLALALIGYFM